MIKYELNSTTRVSNKPIYIIITYLMITQLSYLLLYYNEDSNMINTLIYTTVNFTFLLFGYYPNWKIKRRVKLSYDNKYINKIIMISAVATSIFSIYNIYSIYPNLTIISEFIFNPGEAYEYVKFINRHAVETNNSLIATVIGVSLSMLTFSKYIYSGFSIVYWNRLTKRNKILVIITTFIYFAQTFLIGAMINLATLFIGLLPFIFYKRRHFKLKHKLYFSILTLLFGILLLYFLGSRDFFKLEKGNTPVLLSGLLGILYYVSHGYVGLSYSLNLPFEFTFGQTFFRGFSTTLLPYFNIQSTFEKSYLARNEAVNGWSASQNWSTIFPWLASDISYWLIPVLMFFVGYTMKVGLKISLLNDNPFALVMIGQLFILCFMIPANNQLLHTFSNGTGFVIIFIMYFKSIANEKNKRS